MVITKVSQNVTKVPCFSYKSALSSSSLSLERGKNKLRSNTLRTREYILERGKNKLRFHTFGQLTLEQKEKLFVSMHLGNSIQNEGKINYVSIHSGNSL